MPRFLVNPTSGGGRGRRFLPRLRERAAALDAEVEVSTDFGDLENRAARAAADGVERLIVAGGDGSIHLAIQGVAGTESELAVIPAGRGNDLVKSLGIPADFDEALELAVDGEARPIDLGRAGDRWFHSYGGAGFDAETSILANAQPRWLPNSLTYAIALVRGLIGFEAPRARVSWDEGAYEGGIMFVTACNAPFYGGGMRIAPSADMTDGLLELVVVREVSKLELLRVFPRVYRGTHVTHPQVEIHRTRRATIALSRPSFVGCDGEVAGEIWEGEMELLVEARPGALRVVTPGGAAS